jgi:hypothetical protein
MTLNASAYLNALHPPLPYKPREVPQLVIVRWTTSKIKSAKLRDPSWREAWATIFPNGRVSLDFGNPYGSLTELKETLVKSGHYRLVYVDATGNPEREESDMEQEQELQA